MLNGLWNYPEAMYHILLNSETEVVQNNLASFIVNNFYCNHLSGNYIENNLLYIISLMLKDEIDKLKDIKQVDYFLENTKCGFLLEELYLMPDIQIFFKNVILKTVEKIERTCSFREIKFKVLEIFKEILKLKDEEEKKLGRKNSKDLEAIYQNIIDNKIFDQSINHSKEESKKTINEDYLYFTQKYSSDLSVKEFESRAEKAKKENNNNLFEYFNKLTNDTKSNNNNNLYANTYLMKLFIDTKLPTYMLSLYQNNFLKIISFIEQLIQDLKENILLLPNSIKYICKIISILIRRKFKNISKIEENSFISRFIIGKLLIPIISLPSHKALINDFIISGNTIKNIKLMNFFIKKLFSGKLFQNNLAEGDYTPFNWFFIDKMENILYFFEKSINVNLPNFIEKFVNDELPSDYSYDFFNENKEEIIANISICFTIDNLNYLIKGLEKSDNLFLSNNPKANKLKRSLSKLKSETNMNEIKKINKNKINKHKENYKKNEKNKNKDVEIENYYLFIEQVIEDKYENLFSLNNQIANFYINIKKTEKNKKLNEKEKIIIKVKNYLCSSLGNYRLLNKSDFSIGATSNIIQMLNEIKSYMSIPNFILDNNTIPSLWYINSILDCLNKLPEDYKENEYKKLFKELAQNLNDSINILDFEKLILFRNKLKFMDKMNNYYDSIKQSFNNILINENVKQIVEEIFIPVDMKFSFDDNEKIFELTKSNIKEKLFEDKIIYQLPKKKMKSFRTIKAFIRYFPNLAKYQKIQGINPIDIIEKLAINQKINNYFHIIEENIIKTINIDINLYNSSYKEKIEDYIMNKIYNKIYPIEPDDIDKNVYNKSITLSWVEPNLIVNKDYIFDNMLPDILNEFNQINKFKNPYKKLNCINKILVYIENLIKFNEGIDKEIGAEDITPVLNYVFIKEHPFRIHTDIEFIKIFLENKGQFENSLVNMESMINVILECNHDSFNLTPEEYNNRCHDATINHIKH